MHRLILSLTAALICFSAATTAEAQEHIDILVFNDNGTIDTGFYDFDLETEVIGYRVFTETFVSFFPGGIYATGAPGFYNTPTYSLPPSTDLAFDALAITHPDTQVDANLLFWDGQGAVDFAAPTDGTTLQFRLSPSTNITVDGSPNDVAGFVLEGTSPSGLIHKHIDFGAFGGGGANPTDGLYLASMKFTMSGLTDSEPVYLLFNAHYQRDGSNNIIYVGDAPQVDPISEGLAVTWIEDNLIAPPLPGDLDGDGFVGLSDLDIILNNWNQAIPPGDPLADPTGDNFVGLADLDIVLNNWNTGTPPSPGGVVPEPVSLMLMGIGASACLMRGGRN